MIKRTLKAFTLIELLVVVSIIGILTTLIFANLNAARERARDVQRKSDLRNIQTSLKVYNIDSASYPLTIPFNSSWTVGDIEYMTLVPNDPQYDPLAPDGPFYDYTSDGNTYTLTACLENVADSKCSSDDSGRCSDTTCLFSVVP